MYFIFSSMLHVLFHCFAQLWWLYRSKNHIKMGFFNFNPLNPSAACKVLSVTFAKERAWCHCSERCLTLVKFVFVTVSLDIVDSIPVIVKQK